MRTIATIKDVARDADVSVATVSNILNNTRFVSEELTNRVLESVKKLSYNINNVGRNLRCKKTNMIGVVLQNVNDVFFSEILLGLEETLRKLNYKLIFINTNYNFEEEKNAIATLRTMWVDGIILDSCVHSENEAEYLEFLLSNGTDKQIPIVTLEHDLIPGKNAVLTDFFQSSVTATEHLIGLGRKKIVHITGLKGVSVLDERERGYTKAMNDANLKPMVYSQGGLLTTSEGYNVTKDILEQGITFDGLFAVNDRMAVGAILAIQDYGLRVPEDVGVIGYDNIKLYNLISPSLSTINVPKYKMGAHAANMLIKCIDNDNQSQPLIKLHTELIVRKSSDPTASSKISLNQL